MLRFEGDRHFPLPLAEVWSKLRDAQFLVHCVPDVQSVRQSEHDSAVFTVRPGVSFVRGILDVSLRVTDGAEANSCEVLVHSKGIGSSADVRATLTMTPQESGTRVHWVAEVEQLGGLLKAVPKGLVQASAQKVIADVWAEIEKKLAGR